MRPIPSGPRRRARAWPATETSSAGRQRGPATVPADGGRGRVPRRRRSPCRNGSILGAWGRSGHSPGLLVHADFRERPEPAAGAGRGQGAALAMTGLACPFGTVGCRSARRIGMKCPRAATGSRGRTPSREPGARRWSAGRIACPDGVGVGTAEAWTTGDPGKRPRSRSGRQHRHFAANGQPVTGSASR